MKKCMSLSLWSGTKIELNVIGTFSLGKKNLPIRKGEKSRSPQKGMVGADAKG